MKPQASKIRRVWISAMFKPTRRRSAQSIMAMLREHEARRKHIEMFTKRTP